MKAKRLRIKNLPVFIIFALLLLLIFNIVASQMISSLYFRLVNENYLASVNYLKKIRFFPQFPTELEKYRQIYGAGVENLVFSSEREREQTIKKYEQALQKNPQSVTALYNLSLLYAQNSNQNKVDEYLRLAKELDPTLR